MKVLLCKTNKGDPMAKKTEEYRKTNPKRTTFKTTTVNKDGSGQTVRRQATGFLGGRVITSVTKWDKWHKKR